MAGPNVEVFKFGLYMFFPVWVMLKFGDPEWYDEYVKPYGELLWPKYETTNRPPKTQTELQTELARMKTERAARRAAQSGDTSSSPATLTTAAPSAVLSAVDDLETTKTPVQYNNAVSYYRSIGRGGPNVKPSGTDGSAEDNRMV